MVIDNDIVIYCLLGLLIVLTILVIRLEIKIKNLLLGTDSKNLSDSIKTIRTELAVQGAFKKDMSEYLKGVEKRLQKSIQGVHTIRFNPFKGDGSGGNQSFATALVNEKGDGVVLSSLYTRDRVSVFSKPVARNSSEYELSVEEKDAILKARELAGEK